MDAIRLYINGLKNVIALMGTALTKEQVELIKRLRSKVILALDGDEAGKTATLKNGDILRKSGVGVSVIRISLKKDPDEYVFTYGIDSYKKMLNQAVDFFDFKIKTLEENINAGNTQEFSVFINQILEDIKESKDSIYQDLSLTKLSNISHIDKEVLKSRLGEMDALKTVAREVFKKSEPVTNSPTLLDKITKELLYYMLNDRHYVIEYQEKIGYFPNKIYRSIANEIVFFIEKNYNITVADFITYISYNEELSNEVEKIIADDKDLSEENFLLTVKSYEREWTREEIARLTKALSEEMDLEKKLALANQIIKIKKGSVM